MKWRTPRQRWSWMSVAAAEPGASRCTHPLLGRQCCRPGHAAEAERPRSSRADHHRLWPQPRAPKDAPADVRARRRRADTGGRSLRPFLMRGRTPSRGTFPRLSRYESLPLPRSDSTCRHRPAATARPAGAALSRSHEPRGRLYRAIERTICTGLRRVAIGSAPEVRYCSSIRCPSRTRRRNDGTSCSRRSDVRLRGAAREAVVRAELVLRACSSGLRDWIDLPHCCGGP